MASGALLRKMLGSVWFKLAVAAIVVGLLFAFNRIETGELRQLQQTWPWLVAAFLLMLPPFLIVSYRFQIILNSQGVQVSFREALRWTMIGSFFDLAMPSSNGGDIVKAGYVVRHTGAGLRTRAVMAVLFDRVLGLLGLFLLASIVSLIGWNVISTLPARNLLLFCLFGASFGALLAFRILGSRTLYHLPILQRLFQVGSWGARARQLISAFNELRERPANMVAALGLSVSNHVFWCLSLLCIARAVGNEVDSVQGFVVFPLAIFSNIFGVAGGFGVGTAAFDLLLSQLLSIGNGALIGLLFQLLGAFTRLAGLPFYLIAARSGQLKAVEAEERAARALN